MFAFPLTMAYSVLSHLSPAALMLGEVGEHVMRWLGLACALACIPRIALHSTFWRSPQTYLMVGLMAIVPVSRMANPEPGGLLPVLRDFAASAIVFFFVLAAVNSIWKLRMLAFAMVLSALYLLSQSLWDIHVHGGDSQYQLEQRVADSNGFIVGQFPRVRSVGFLEDPNDFAQYLLVAATLLGFAWSTSRRWRNVVFVALPLAYLTYGIYATHSRGAIAGVLVVAFVLLQTKIRWKTSLALCIALFAVLVVAGAAGPRTTAFTEPNVAGRVQAWQAGLAMFRAEPWFGVGFRQFDHYNNNFTAHNSFVLCIAELGLLGYLFWLGLIVYSLFDLNSVIRSSSARETAPQLVRSAFVIRAALLAFLIPAWFLSRTYVVTLYLLLGMAAATGRLLAESPDIQPVSPRPRAAATVLAAAGSMVLVLATVWVNTL